MLFGFWKGFYSFITLKWGMKSGGLLSIVGFLSFLIVITMSLSNSASAITKDIEISENESYSLNSINISLLSSNYKKEKVLLCVNDRNIILRENEYKYISDLELEIKLKGAHRGYANFRINLPKCSECVCEGSCLNLRCFNVNLCENDSDCEDENEDTEDACIGTPKRCYHVEVEQKINKEDISEEKDTNEILEGKEESLKTDEGMLNDGVVAMFLLFTLIIILSAIVLWRKIK